MQQLGLHVIEARQNVSRQESAHGGSGVTLGEYRLEPSQSLMCRALVCMGLPNLRLDSPPPDDVTGASIGVRRLGKDFQRFRVLGVGSENLAEFLLGTCRVQLLAKPLVHLDELAIVGFGGGVCLHGRGPITGVFQVQTGPGRLSSMGEVERQSLGRAVAVLALQGFRQSTVQCGAAGEAQVAHHHVSNQLVGELVGVIGALHEEFCLAGSFEAADDIVFAPCATAHDTDEGTPRRHRAADRRDT